MLRLASALSLVVAASLSAQTAKPPAAPVAPAGADSGGHTIVSGFVLDSMTNQPLAGATVVISGTALSTTTDDAGRFRFVVDTLHEGTYTLGFFHPALDSVGITLPTQTVVVRHGVNSIVELGVPSMTTIVAHVCPDSSRTDGRGLVMGVVREAGSNKPVGGEHVVLMWSATTVAGGSMVKVPMAVSALTAPDGSYSACGVASGTTLSVQARGPSGRSGWVETEVPLSGVAFRNFLIGTPSTSTVASRGASAAPTGAASAAATDSGATPGSRAGAGGANTPVGARRAAAPKAGAATGAASASDAAEASASSAPVVPLGTSAVVGTVTTENGKPLEGAQVMLLGTRLITRSNDRGAFRLGGLPAGTQSIEVREIGYSPKRFAVDLAPNQDAHVSAVLAEHAAVLAAVEVQARKGSDIPGFETRKKQGFGSFLTQDQIANSGALDVSDLFRTIPGVQVTWDGQEYQVEMSRAAAGGVNCPVEYYLDGAPFLAMSSDDIDKILKPEDISAIEVYKSAIETPPQFQGSDGGACGTIVIWTKRGGPRPKDAPGSGNPYSH